MKDIKTAIKNAEPVILYILVLVFLFGSLIACLWPDIQKELKSSESETNTATEQNPASKTIQVNEFEQASDEELIKELERRFSNHTMDTICKKLAYYAKGLDDEVEYGVITLSEGEMQILRKYIKQNIKTVKDRYDTFEGFSAIGNCKYQDYKFMLDKERQIIFIAPEYRKPIAITNSVDHPDNNATAYHRVCSGYSDGYVPSGQYDLINTKDYCYTYQRDMEKVTIRKWQYAKLIDEWSCDAWKYDNVFYGAPETLYWQEDEDEYSLIAEAHLLMVHNGKLIVLAEGLDYDTEACMIPGMEGQFFYIQDNELNTVNIDTLEVCIATDVYPEIFKRLS